MRSITLFFAGILSVVFITTSSCKKSSPAPANNSQNNFSASFANQVFSYTQNLQMTIANNNTASISALEPGTDNSLALYIGAADTGTYTGSSNTYISLVLGFVPFVSDTPGGSCTVRITEFDTTTMRAQGTFSGKVVGGESPLVISNGSFSVQFQR